MGLQDRDYTHERRERPFTPAGESETPTWLIVLVLALAGGALYQAYVQWWLPRPRTGETTSAPVPAARLASPATGLEERPVASPEPLAGWTRCDMDGRVLYTDGPCPGTRSTGRQVATRPARPVPATTLTLYHCKGYDDRTFWANSHCNQHRALVDRLVNVPAHLPFDEQVAIANGQRQAAQQVLDQQAATAAGTHTVVDSKVMQCRELDEQVRHLDAMARQPQSGNEQDRIRGERQKVRDWQFRLRC